VLYKYDQEYGHIKQVWDLKMCSLGHIIDLSNLQNMDKDNNFNKCGLLLEQEVENNLSHKILMNFVHSMEKGNTEHIYY
jgi:hypothetical protein